MCLVRGPFHLAVSCRSSLQWSPPDETVSVINCSSPTAPAAAVSDSLASSRARPEHLLSTLITPQYRPQPTRPAVSPCPGLGWPALSQASEATDARYTTLPSWEITAQMEKKKNNKASPSAFRQNR